MSEQNRKTPFISRWSRLKYRAKHADGSNSKVSTQDVPTKADSGLEQNTLHPGTKRPESESTNEIVKQLAIKKIITLPKWSTLDGLNEYDEDYRAFSPLGSKLTHDLIRQIQRDANRLSAAISSESSAVQSDADHASDSDHTKG